jgi:hypothetical protein
MGAGGSDVRVCYKHFRGSFKSWQQLFLDATDFATGVGADRLISISHSSDHSDGVVTVWYWGTPERCYKCAYDLTGNESGKCPECGTAV